MRTRPAILAARLAGHALSGLLLSGLLAPAHGAGFETRVGGTYRFWKYGPPAAEVQVDQLHVPVDLYWRLLPALRLGAGGDFAVSARQGAGQRFSSPGELRGSLEYGPTSGRFRLDAGARTSLRRESLSPQEIRIVEALETTGLDFPLTEFAAGDRGGVQAGWQLVRRRALLLQIGGGFEWRGPYNLRAGEQRFDPGNAWTAGGSAQGVAGSFRPGLSMVVRGAGRHHLPDGIAYETGPQVEGAIGTDWLAAPGWRLALTASMLARGHGTTETHTPLERAALRGGNAAGGRLLLAREWPRWTAGLSLGVTGLRGFAGELGHATWFAPGLDLGHTFDDHWLGLGARAWLGEGRSTEPVRGVGLSFEWRGSWLR